MENKSRMPVTLDQTAGLSVIRLEGEINIASAGELKDLLLRGLASGKELRVDMGKATELDVTALQLLWAADREARKSATRFLLAGPIPDEISVMAAEAGFDTFPVPTDVV